MCCVEHTVYMRNPCNSCATYLLCMYGSAGRGLAGWLSPGASGRRGLEAGAAASSRCGHGDAEGRHSRQSSLPASARGMYDTHRKLTPPALSFEKLLQVSSFSSRCLPYTSKYVKMVVDRDNGKHYLSSFSEISVLPCDAMPCHAMRCHAMMPCDAIHVRAVQSTHAGERGARTPVCTK